MGGEVGAVQWIIQSTDSSNKKDHQMIKWESAFTPLLPRAHSPSVHVHVAHCVSRWFSLTCFPVLGSKYSSS